MRFSTHILLIVALWETSLETCPAQRIQSPHWESMVQRSPGAKSPESQRQCSGVYFSREKSCWFRVDCLVKRSDAEVGVFTLAELPGLGSIHVWILKVYEQPQLTPPSFSDPSQIQPTEARVSLNLPPHSRLLVNGQTVESYEGMQEILVPDLSTSFTYEYDLRLELSDAAEDVIERKISFRAGSRKIVDLQSAENQDAAEK